MNKKKEWLLLGVTLVICILLFCERLTGQIVHAVLGVALIAVLAVHIGKQSKKLKYRKASVRWLDMALMAILAVLFVSGMLAHPLHDVLAVKIIHKLAAVLFVLGIIAHVVQYHKMKKGRH